MIHRGNIVFFYGVCAVSLLVIFMITTGVNAEAATRRVVWFFYSLVGLAAFSLYTGIGLHVITYKSKTKPKDVYRRGALVASFIVGMMLLVYFNLFVWWFVSALILLVIFFEASFSKPRL